MTNTGQRIYDWLEGMFRIGVHSVGFDRDTYYHCRTRRTEDMPFAWEEMQRAPHGIPGTGRFNTPGSAYFYFASTRQGAENEIRKYLREGESLQTVRVSPSGNANLLDLSHTLQRGKTFLRMIRFELSESSQDNKFPKEYLLPCYVANCCKRIGYDGIAYHGAKGYTNYVTWNDGWFSFAGMC